MAEYLPKLPIKENRPQKSKGFSLLEVLVATAVLALVAVAVAAIASGTAQITSLSQKRMAADATARQALDRIGTDFSSAILRGDLKREINDSLGNDEIAFYARTDGYVGNRGISEVHYRINDEDQLERGVQGFAWNEEGQVPSLRFNAPAVGEASTISDEDFEIISSDVFRFEVAFLMGDGSIWTNVPGLSAGADSDPAHNVAAVIVAIAALNQNARDLLSGGITELQNEFPDAINSSTPGGEDILSLWVPVVENIRSNEDVPRPVREGLRIYQRYFYLGR